MSHLRLCDDTLYHTDRAVAAHDPEGGPIRMAIFASQNIPDANPPVYAVTLSQEARNRCLDALRFAMDAIMHDTPEKGRLQAAYDELAAAEPEEVAA